MHHRCFRGFGGGACFDRRRSLARTRGRVGPRRGEVKGAPRWKKSRSQTRARRRLYVIDYGVVVHLTNTGRILNGILALCNHTATPPRAHALSTPFGISSSTMDASAVFRRTFSTPTPREFSPISPTLCAEPKRLAQTCWSDSRLQSWHRLVESGVVWFGVVSCRVLWRGD